jgi:hypothetical protein
VLLLSLSESISRDLRLVSLLVCLLESSFWSLSLACSHDSIFWRNSFGFVSSSGADKIGLDSLSGDGEDGRSLSEVKSAPSKAGLFR